MGRRRGCEVDCRHWGVVGSRTYGLVCISVRCYVGWCIRMSFHYAVTVRSLMYIIVGCRVGICPVSVAVMLLIWTFRFSLSCSLALFMEPSELVDM